MTETPLEFCHVALWCDDLETATATFAEKTGFQPLYGGRHERPGTWNKLCGAGENGYVELIAADPDNKLDGLMRKLLEGHPNLAPCVVAFKCDDLEGFAAKAQQLGVQTEGPFNLSRTSDDGSEVLFEALSLHHPDHRLPVLLDWKDVPHPTTLLGDGVTIVDLEAVSPVPEALSELLQQLNIPLTVRQSERSGFRARIDGPTGTLESEA
ncbi:MAG: VOC family protein [Pseudomonadota bacterium]